jgi:hypothetical protein
MIALHARRSAASVAAWQPDLSGRRPLLLVLTGTDLYRDIVDRRSGPALAGGGAALVVLHEAWRAAPARTLARQGTSACSRHRRAEPLAKTRRHLRALMVGHLREEKSPQTYFDAARRLAHRTTSGSTTSAVPWTRRWRRRHVR